MTANSGAGSSSSYQLVSADPQDAEAIHAIREKAFAFSLLHEQVYPKDKAHLTPPDELYAWRVRSQEKAMQADDLLYSKVVTCTSDEPQKIVAYAGWVKPGHFSGGKTLSDAYGPQATPDTKPQTDLTASREPSLAADQQAEGFPACMDIAIHQHFLSIMDEERKKIWGDDANYWCGSPACITSLCYPTLIASRRPYSIRC